MLRFNLLKYT